MLSSTRGQLLVASPDLDDPNFRRTVVLVIAHDADGALGVVINRPTDISVGEALVEWEGVASEPACLHAGGPVEPDSAVALGVGPPDPTGSSPGGIVGLMGTVDLDGRPDDYRAVRVFVGYSGWGGGQLDSEIARGDWIVVDATVGDLTTAASESLWRDVLRRQRGRVAMFATASEDPTLN